MVTPDDFGLWAFAPELTAESEILCPECEEWSAIDGWNPDGSLPCDTCGDHGALVCPECGHPFDHVWTAETFRTRVPA